MKTIEFDDETYDSLMDLVKELQTQDNDRTAFPFIWSPASRQWKPCPNGCGERTIVYSSPDNDSYTFEEFTESHPELLEEFEEDGMDEVFAVDEVEDEFFSFLVSRYPGDFDLHREELVQVVEGNTSVFKSDAAKFCEENQHHLGQDPHTYCQHSWRMPKMEKLMKVLCSIDAGIPDCGKNHEVLAAIRTKNKDI